MAMDTKRKLVIVGIRTIGESYCSPECAYFQMVEGEEVEDKKIYLCHCGLMGAWTPLKKNNMTQTYKRTKACLLKEVKIKRNAM
jgi:hypothetical protein